MPSREGDKKLLDTASYVADGLPVTKAMLLYEAIDHDGGQILGTYTSEGLTPWEIMGILEFNLARYRMFAEDVIEGDEE